MTAPAERSSVREKTWRLLDGAVANNPLGQAIRLALLGLIVANLLALVAESHLARDDPKHFGFAVFDHVSCAIFAVEYFARLWACVEDRRFRRPFVGRVKFALTPLAILDALAIAPALLYLTAVDLRFLRTARLLRIGRVFKMGRYSRALQNLGSVLRSRSADLVSAMFVMGIMLVTASTLVFYAERDAQPDVFPNITAALWWGIVTMTTVGYGDVFPITGIGRALAATISILGLGLFALPAGIIADGYREALAARRTRPRKHARCPHCGEPLPPDPAQPPG